jgi:hypothetical protein
MKRILTVVLLLALGIQVAAPALAARVRVVKRGHHRTTVVVRRGFPIVRAPRVVVVRAPRRAVVVAPVVFLAPVVFAARVVALPPGPAVVWEDAEPLSQDEDWTEFTLNADSRGRALLFEVIGRVQVEWAEVVFENGDTRVVDFNAKTVRSGVYPLLDFADGRRVDHVRMVARAKSPEARVVLRMVK